MHLPPHFKGDRLQNAALIEVHPFASLIGTDNAELPFVTHLPLHLEQRGEQLVLLGHVAKPNPVGAIYKRVRRLWLLFSDHMPTCLPRFIRPWYGCQSGTTLQCKLKLNQHRPEAYSAMRAIYAGGTENEQSLAYWMDRLDMNAEPQNRQEN